MKEKRQIAILGSTGSIGTQAHEVIEEHSDLYEVYCLTANNRVELLAEQAHKFKPAAIVIANEARYDELKSLMSDMPDVKVYAGRQALDEIVEAGPINMVLTAMVGFAGLSPTIHAIRAGKAIALANKETLVVAGELILQLAQQYHTPILPVDSEHSAIFQSLVGEDQNPIEKFLQMGDIIAETMQRATFDKAPDYDIYVKTHGVKGEISLLFDDDVFDRVDADYLVLKIDGIFVPFFMEEYRFKSDANAIMKFEGIDTQECARELTGCEVWFPRDLNDSEDMNLASLAGFTIFDAASQKAVGRIASVDDTTLNLLFELEDGKLIPASEDIISSIDPDSRTITMTLPQGLLDL